MPGPLLWQYYPSRNAHSISGDNELADPLYDTIPYSDLAEVQTKGTQVHGKKRTHKRVHIYDKIIYEDAQQPIQRDTRAAAKNVMENVSKDESQSQVSENNDE